MKVALIIVTKDRPDDIERCLTRAAQVQPTFSNVIIVDSSEHEASKQKMDAFIRQLNITYQHSQPGITKQRNIARGLVPNDIDVVLYIDDDVRLAPDTVKHITDFFQNQPKAVGMTGTIIGEAPHSRFKRILGSLTLLYTPKVFGFTAGLFNIINTPTTTTTVDWLPGAFMAYRWSAVQDLEFDEWFTTYGLGEDFDFSYRASMLGAVICEIRLIGGAYSLFGRAKLAAFWVYAGGE